MERSEEPGQSYREEIAQVPVEKLVFLDERGFSLNLHRLYGWVVGGKRCMEIVPFNKGVNRSVLGAFSLPTPACPTGLHLLWQKLGAWNRDSFEAFLQDGLLPVLELGSVLVLDNARIHRGGNIETLVKAANCSLLYLPAYSPDLNPIELVWSWLKARVRTLAPKDDDTRAKEIRRFDSEIHRNAKDIPTKAATKWFKHCVLRTHQLDRTSYRNQCCRTQSLIWAK